MVSDVRTAVGRTARASWAAASCTGAARDVNEDFFAVYPERERFVVGDGCGGTFGSGEAAAIVLAPFADAPRGEAGIDPLAAALAEANRRLFDVVRADPSQGMGCTLAALHLAAEWATVVHAGDCRAYVFRGGTLRRLTTDHLLLVDLVLQGPPNAATAQALDYRNIIMRAVGVTDSLDIDLQYSRIEPGDLYVLCSDGLTGLLDDAKITAALASPAPLMERARALVAGADGDNATVVLVQI